MALGVLARGIFRGYGHLLAVVPPVFAPGDTIVLTGIEPDAFQCCLADGFGAPIASVSDTLFAEEVHWFTQMK